MSKETLKECFSARRQHYCVCHSLKASQNTAANYCFGLSERRNEETGVSSLSQRQQNASLTLVNLKDLILK